jgi:NAD(P)-dependent dehydrogenase (short-subunit alcohol dehydrogenase family)
VAAAAGEMRDKVCLVTGASSGIGRETALALAERGARLVLLCRSRERGEEMRRTITERTGRDDVSLVLADLSSQAEIRRVAAEILAAEPRIDVLVNNAGLVNLRREVTGDGIEAVLAVNHLAYFLLTNLLLDRLRASGKARIVNVSSDAHKFRGFDLDDLQFERRKYGWSAAYGQSKLCNILFTRELARRLEGSGVTVNALHPGAVATRLAQNNGWWAVALGKLLALFLRTPAKGAETSVYLATSPEMEGITGRYFSDCREARPSRMAEDDAAAKRLWEISARLTGLAT